MCGITGIYSPGGRVRSQDILRMTGVLRHRGPDDEGFLAVEERTGKPHPLRGGDSRVENPGIEDFFEESELFLGHRRLSIIDLSPAGHQPMSNEDGSFWIVHNGEIYNYVEIRKDLEALGHCFRSQTDTEVILHAYEAWGVECLDRFNGMWAFSIWDSQKRRLFCARDRAGVKPFYYFFDGKRFAFASEIKALLTLNGFRPKPNQQVLADYLFSGLVDHTGETFFEGVCQLRPGEYLLFNAEGLTVRSYWDIEPERVHLSRKEDFAQQFYELFQDSLRLRLRTDVAVGTCLSGGLDSSSIVCLANRLMFDGETIDPRLVGEKQKTFSSCFEDPLYDERRFIEEVIRKTGAEKNYVFPEAVTLLGDLPRVIWHQDEPFGSTSVYAQWSVMQRVRQRGVTVLLDGQGPDELLAGYLPAFSVLFKGEFRRARLWRFLKEFQAFRDRRCITLNQWLPRLLVPYVPDGLNAILRTLRKGEVDWAEPGFRKKYLRSISTPNRFRHDLDRYLYLIFRHTVLPGLLHYEDRNSMAFSLETRLPFLDYRLVEFSFSLPVEQKIKDGMSKVVLRNAMAGILPEAVRNRVDKMGFVTPEEVWFRTVLRSRIEEILGSRSFAERGYFRVEKVKEAFRAHCEARQNLSPAIWRWVNLELWFRCFFDRSPFPVAAT
jgi:asparagine synthase (glutamine-hydrolysing)